MSAVIPERIVNELPTLNNVVISPDGATILYVRSQVNAETGKPESQIWRCDRDGGNRRQLTHVGTGNGSPVWSPDGSQIAFTSQREGDLPAAICLLRLDGGEAEVLTQHMTPPLGLAWSPDGATLAYALSVDPENPNETPRDPKAPAPVRVVRRFAYKADGMGYRGDVHSQIFLFDLASRERKQLTTEPIDHMTPRWSPDNTTLAVNLWAEGPLHAQIGLVDVESGETRRIGEPSAFLGSFSWSPSGEKLLFETALADYGVIDVATGAIRPVIENNPAFMPGGAFDPSGGMIWLDESTVVAPGFAAGASGLWQIDLESGTAVEKGRWPAMHGGIAAGSDVTGVVQDISALSGVTGLVSINAQTGERTVLFDETADLFAEMPLAQWERISVERGDLTIEGFLLKPANFDERKSYPVIVDIHGGPQGMQLYRVDPVSQNYATNGFLVVMPDPRGSTSYGRAFSEAVYEDWGYEDWQDIQALLDLVLERPYADKERTGVYGYSYGGYMTSWAIGQTDRFKAAVCGAPCFDLESMYGTSDIAWILGAMQWGGAPWENREWLIEHSPSSHIHKAVTPTLIVQGEADERCPVGQSEQMFISLKTLGVETEFVRYPGGFHAFPWSGEPAHRIDYMTRTLAWFKKYLGDPA